MSDDLAKIPATEFDFGLWLINLRLDAQSDPHLTGEARAAILEQFDVVRKTIVTLENLRAAGLLQTEADGTLQAVAEGLHAAIRIGAYSPDALRTPPTRAARKKRMQAPQAGRRRDVFQEIVDRAAKELWAQKRELIGEPGQTAKQICDSVAAELPKLAKPPKGYENADLTDPKTQRRFIDLLRHRVERIK